MVPVEVCYPAAEGCPPRGSPGGGLLALRLCRSVSAACGGHGLMAAGAKGLWDLACRAPFSSARSTAVPPLLLLSVDRFFM